MSLDTQAPFPYPKRVSRSVVWFRDGDLRLEDHTGLESACEHTSHALAPLFVLTPKTKPASLQAARRLRKELRDRGSDLILRFAEDEATGVIQFLTEFGAERVHVRMDVEYEARDVVYQVERCLDGVTSVQTWDMELREWDGSKDELGDMPDVFPDFLRWKKRLKTPVAESSVLFQPDRIIPGPDLYEDDRLGEVDILVEEKSNMSEQQREFMSEYNRDMEFVSAMEVDLETERYGEFVVREYLRKADAYEKVDLGRSFAEVFRQGALAPARIFEIVHEHERKNGRIWRWAYREGAKMILDWLDAREFATLMARRDVANGATVDGEHEAKFWRWNGYLMRYVEEGRDSEGAKNKPPLLLVHGFGASSQHFRRSLKVLKERYHVYAVDLVGFGRSEKPPMQYTQALWECLLWDFVRDVIRKPVFVAGNSIGKFFLSSKGRFSCGLIWC